jgi:hypothetical protein
MLIVLVWLAGAALAQEVDGRVDSRVQLMDALLLESRGDLDGAVMRYTELARTLGDTDPVRAEALYWLGHGLWSTGRIQQARQALMDGIRSGFCSQCKDLLEVIEIDATSIHRLPVREDFEGGTHPLFHPWRVQPLGQIRVGVGPRGDTALEWSTVARPGEADRLVLGLQHPTPAPTMIGFHVMSARLDALLDVVGVDDRGRTFGLREAVAVPRGVHQRVVVLLERLVPVDGGAPLRPEELVLLSIVDRTASRAAGENRFWLDELELR